MKSQHIDLGARRVKVQDNQREAARGPALQEPRALTTEGALSGNGLPEQGSWGEDVLCERMSHLTEGL